MSGDQQDLDSVKQQSFGLKAEATHRSEELTSTQLMLPKATVIAQQARQVCELLLSTVTSLLSQASY